jgi:hypothetical protein
VNNELMNFSKICAYLLWEHTGYDNALVHWKCSEDIACYFEKNKLTSINQLYDILNKGINNTEYKQIINNISYRIYCYTDSNDCLKNWLISENLIHNLEWSNPIIGLANIYKHQKLDNSFVSALHSNNVKTYYINQKNQIM